MLARLVEFPTEAIRSEGTGWKVILRTDRWAADGWRLLSREFNNIAHGSPPSPGTWAQAWNAGQPILAESGEQYPAGFHILLDRPEWVPRTPGYFVDGVYVQLHYLVIQVQYRGALCAGVDGGALYKDRLPHPCVVAAEMFIELSDARRPSDASLEREVVSA